MYLIQILLPLRDNEGEAFPREWLDRVRASLTERFGGATAHLQAPAEGLWKDPEGGIDRDRVVIIEVMAERLDRDWWRRYRSELEARFRQEEVVIRATETERL